MCTAQQIRLKSNSNPNLKLKLKTQSKLVLTVGSADALLAGLVGLADLAGQEAVAGVGSGALHDLLQPQVLVQVNDGSQRPQSDRLDGLRTARGRGRWRGASMLSWTCMHSVLRTVRTYTAVEPPLSGNTSCVRLQGMPD